jgi:hypothetical protein
MPANEPRSVFDRTNSAPPLRPGSIFSAQSIDTVVADTSYRGFPSEQAYLDALKAWAQSKMYYETGDQMSGFYGKETVDDVLHKQGTVRKPLRSKRRATVAPQLDTVAERDGSNTALSRHSSAHAATDTTAPQPEAKESRLKKVFTRRKTLV